MKKCPMITGIVAVLLFGGQTYAQTPPAATPPAAAPATPSFTVKSITPPVIASESDKDLKKEIIIRGKGLQGIVDVVLTNKAGQPTSLPVTVIDNASDTSMKLSVDVSMDDDNVYHLQLDKTDVDGMTLTVKNMARVADERAEAERKRAVQQAAAAIAATNTLKSMVGQQAQTIESLQKRLKAMEDRTPIGVTEVNMLIDKKVQPVQETLNTHAKLIEATATATQAASDAVSQLQIDTGILAQNFPKKGGFLGLGAKRPQQVVAVSDRYKAAIDAANAAAANPPDNPEKK